MDLGPQARLLVDQFMPSFVPGGMGGTETYARHIFDCIKDVPEVSALAIVPESAKGFTRPGDERLLVGVDATGSTIARLRTALQVWLRSRQIGNMLRPGAVTFVPFTTPLIAARSLGKTVITLHDIQHRELPELFSTAEKLYRKIAYEQVARNADHIITVSEYAKETIVRELGVDETRVSAIHLGVDADVFSANFGERENFVYYPARGWAHKNHRRLFKAMEIVRNSFPDMRLVLTGGALEDIGDVPKWVERKGLVSFEEVQSLYREAKVLAFPSLYEGFGFPPLEAMASGCPVAASNVASIPEICGDAAVYFDPRDPNDIARGIIDAIRRRDRLVPLGLERVKKFTWKACADGHLRVFRELNEQPS